MSRKNDIYGDIKKKGNPAVKDKKAGTDFRDKKTGQAAKKTRPDFKDKKAGQAANVKKAKQPVKDKSLEQGKQAKSACPASKRCGGCQYIDVPYADQLKTKLKYVNKLLEGAVKIDEIIGMENPYHYRNKVHAVLGVEKGKVISGVYEAGTHHVVPVKSCLIENETADRIIQTIVSLMPSFKIKAYDEDSGYGYLRHILIRTGHVTGQVMVVLVAVDTVFPSKKNFVKVLREKHPEISTVVLNINSKSTSMVLGDRELVLYGKGYIEDELCGKRYIISPKSFYQINSVQTEKLYRKAIEFAGLTGKERVIDAYCGIGTIGISAADKAGEVIGVELNADAVKDAIKNAKQNNINNIKFYKNDAGDFMQSLAADGETADVVIMDPPRSGSDERFMDAVAALSPSRVVYVSCGPDTLARDLKYFEKKGYKAEKAVAVDMFPMTVHVETVVLLSQQKADDYVEVELELDALDVTSAESKATYKEIQEYVLKEHGLKVSNLYISQVKRKCGIEVGENYNLPKSEDSRQPQCPVEKEKAIKDALEHFGMV